jgi:predicted transposase/invertase (TIGR01784 family)
MKTNQHDDSNVNRNHKNSVFSALFSNPDVLRELYSAIEGVTLPPDIPVDINTLTDIIYKDQINDISFTIDNRLVVLIEHQSTINNNIPLRLLMYLGRIYEKIVSRRKLYQTKLEKIPAPEFIVLYNGSGKCPDYLELKLSDAFKDTESLKLTDSIPLELKVQVYNINQGHNSEMLKKCETLDSYSIFVDKIREYQSNLTLDESVKHAVKYCIDNKILKKFLETHSSEVFNMLSTEWDWEEALEVAREEAWEDGHEEGMGKGRTEGLEEGMELAAYNALSKGIPIQTVQEITGLEMNAIEAIRAKL